MRVNDILGIRRDRIKSSIADLYGEHRVAVQEKLVELDNRIDWGQRFATQAANDKELSTADRIRRYQQAQLALERARELIKYMPVEVSTEEQSNVVNRLIAETNKAIKAAQTELANTDRETAQKLTAEQAAHEREKFEKKIAVMIDLRPPRSTKPNNTRRPSRSRAKSWISIPPTRRRMQSSPPHRRRHTRRSANSSTKNTANNSH